MKVILLAICFLAVARGNPTAELPQDKHEILTKEVENLKTFIENLKEDELKFINKQISMLSSQEADVLKNATNIFKDISGFAELEKLVISANQENILDLVRCHTLYFNVYEKAKANFSQLIKEHYSKERNEKEAILLTIRKVSKNDIESLNACLSSSENGSNSCKIEELSKEYKRIESLLAELNMNIEAIIEEENHLNKIKNQAFTNVRTESMTCLKSKKDFKKSFSY